MTTDFYPELPTVGEMTVFSEFMAKLPHTFATDFTEANLVRAEQVGQDWPLQWSYALSAMPGSPWVGVIFRIEGPRPSELRPSLALAIWRTTVAVYVQHDNGAVEDDPITPTQWQERLPELLLVQRGQD